MTIESDFAELVKDCGFTENEILSPRRRPEIVDARQAIAICLRYKGHSFPAIGSVMKRDHTSILHLVQRRDTPEMRGIAEKMKKDKKPY